MVARGRLGGLKREGAGCVNAALNGNVLDVATYTVSHTVGTGVLTITEVGGTLCNFSGNTQVYGSVVEGSGRFTCPPPVGNGAWTMRDDVLPLTHFLHN